MPAGLALNRATVDIPGEGLVEGVSATVRRGIARLRNGSTILVQREGVTSVVPTARRQWTVNFEDGTSWQVLQEQCLPCSARKGSR